MSRTICGVPHYSETEVRDGFTRWRDERIAHLESQLAELAALRADAERNKRAIDVLFEDDSGDLDYIKWYIRQNVLKPPQDVPP